MQAWFEKVGGMFETAFITGDRWKLYISGLGVTLEIAFFAAILGLLIGTVLALMKLSTTRKGKKTIWARIANAYIDVIRELSDEELSEAIFIERAAVKLSSDLPSKVREKFLRNLGSAYELQADMDNAFLQYKEAYQIDRGNWRTTHCIASWYRKQAM